MTGSNNTKRVLLKDALGNFLIPYTGGLSPTAADVAAADKLGVIKPDNNTVSVAQDGTLSVDKDGIVTLAHELDWANAIQVSTTNQHDPAQTYTSLSDGVFLAHANGSSADCRIYIQGFQVAGTYVSNSNTGCYLSAWFPVLSGETVSFTISGSGSVWAYFVPFKKS